MNLYRWHSKYLQNVGTGQIIVYAETVAAARDIARRDYEAYSRTRYDYLYCQPDEDDWAELAGHREYFDHDIAAEPEIITGTLFIPGSQ